MKMGKTRLFVINIIIIHFCLFSNGFCIEEKKFNFDSIMDGFEEDSSDNSDQELHDVLGEFEDSGDYSSGKTGRRIIPGCISGHLRLSSSFAFSHGKPESNEPDHRGITRLVPEILLEYEKDFYKKWKVFLSGKAFYDFAYTLKGRGDYPENVLDDYETELEFKEAYVEGALFNNLDLKFGRQIVVWGKSDNIRVADVINPLDNREPGVTDIEDLRLPAAMTRLDLYTGKWNLTGLVIHEAEFNKNPVSGSDFYNYDRVFFEDEPDSDFSNTQWGLSWQGFFTGWDLSFYYADVYSHESYASKTDSGFELEYSRMTMAGSAVAAALGNYLLKMETAFLKGLDFYSTDDEKDRLDIMAGIEYQGITDTTLTMEIVNRHIFDFEEAMEDDPDRAKENRLETVFRYSGDFFHETFNLTGLFILYGDLGDDGSMSRITGEYDVTDSFSVKIGTVFYESGNLKKMDGTGDNDRIFTELKYSF